MALELEAALAPALAPMATVSAPAMTSALVVEPAAGADAGPTPQWIWNVARPNMVKRAQVGLRQKPSPLHR